MLAASGHTTKGSDYVTLLLKTIRSVLVNDSDSRVVVFDLGMDNAQQMRVKDYIGEFIGFLFLKKKQIAVALH